MDRKEQEVAIMIDALADKGKKALEALSKKSQEEINHIVHQMSLAAVDQHMVLAKLYMKKLEEVYIRR